MNFKEKYDFYLNIVNQELEKEYIIPDVAQKDIFSAMNYGIMGGGKRIRPVLVIAVCDMLGGNLNDAARVGMAIESVHNYSLIHDDLPCMDDDELRRGRPTCHIAYPENIALLAGDGLLNKAFEILSDSEKFESLGATELLSIIRILSASSGVWGMIGGQVIDLQSENRSDITYDELVNLHRNKTGELIKASALCGYICGGLRDESNEIYKSILQFSLNLGLVFQIKDDILDVVGDTEILGKPVGSDDKRNKNTFVTLLGIDGAKKELFRLTDEAKRVIKNIDNSDFLIEFADYLLERNY